MSLVGRGGGVQLQLMISAEKNTCTVELTLQAAWMQHCREHGDSWLSPASFSHWRFIACWPNNDNHVQPVAQWLVSNKEIGLTQLDRWWGRRGGISSFNQSHILLYCIGWLLVFIIIASVHYWLVLAITSEFCLALAVMNSVLTVIGYWLPFKATVLTASLVGCVITSLWFRMGSICNPGDLDNPTRSLTWGIYGDVISCYCDIIIKLGE